MKELPGLCAALVQAGTLSLPVWFLSAEDAGHGFSKADNRDFLHQVTLNFVQRPLKPAP